MHPIGLEIIFILFISFPDFEEQGLLFLSLELFFIPLCYPVSQSLL